MLKVRPFGGQLGGQQFTGTVQHAVALAQLAEQAFGIAVEQPAYLGVGLAQGRSQQAPGKDQGVVRLVEQHRAAEDPLVLGGVGRRRMLEAHLGGWDVQPGDPAAEGHPASQGLFGQQGALLR
ncbi:hypothetical protein FQZ97_894080 [compost metagenome]